MLYYHVNHCSFSFCLCRLIPDEPQLGYFWHWGSWDLDSKFSAQVHWLVIHTLLSNLHWGARSFPPTTLKIWFRAKHNLWVAEGRLSFAVELFHSGPTYNPPFFFQRKGCCLLTSLATAKGVGEGDRRLLQHYSTHWCWLGMPFLHPSSCHSLFPWSVSTEELSAVVACCWDASCFLFWGELWVLTYVQQETPLNIGTWRLPGSLGGSFLFLEAAGRAEGL